MKNAVFTRSELDGYFASYVGMEGGNPGASVWFCDGSPHPWFEHLTAPLRPRMSPPAWDTAFRTTYRESLGRWLGHQHIARIMAAARAEVLGLPLGAADCQQYYEQQLYGPWGAEFKLSLFPLPLHLDGLTPWSKVFRGQRELVPKQRYLDLCRHGGRFRFLSEICTRWQPKLVVCLGHRHTEDFIRAFALGDMVAEELLLQPADQAKHLRMFKRCGTGWIICPALAGTSGMNSDVLLNAFGRLLATHLNPSDFHIPKGTG
ncbi:transcriptional regulator [Cupriavidus basilensis]|uniref:Transcriptional regulator n=1 Tax=Cupriavidus basilensis TaxID=68895 RepID=A0ABT6B0N1_9BURK|nr:transcriptional regulator [Cupriavidus basilensis]MDF3838444.1 transcriptional regulator [Cupriavidus basilensis]